MFKLLLDKNYVNNLLWLLDEYKIYPSSLLYNINIWLTRDARLRLHLSRMSNSDFLHKEGCFDALLSICLLNFWRLDLFLAKLCQSRHGWKTSFGDIIFHRWPWPYSLHWVQKISFDPTPSNVLCCQKIYSNQFCWVWFKAHLR